MIADPHFPDAFRALADPTRRQIVAMLAQSDLTVGAVAQRFDISRPAVAKHLGILEGSRLIAVEVRGRERINRLNPAALAPVRDWIAEIESFWDGRLAALKDAVELERTRTMTEMKHPEAQAEAPLVKTIYLDATPEKVWAFLTEADKIGRWFNQLAVNLAPSSRYEMTNSAGKTVIRGEVLDWQPFTRLVTTFEVDAFEGRSTTVAWDLADVDGGTLLTMTHSGIREVGPKARAMLLGLDEGWDEHFADFRKAVAA